MYHIIYTGSHRADNDEDHVDPYIQRYLSNCKDNYDYKR